MSTVLAILAIFLLIGVCLIGLVSLVFGFPGTVVILGAAGVYAWATGFAVVGWATLGWLAAMAATAEIIEFLAGTVAAAGARPSRRVTVMVLAGGFLGGLLGAPFLFGLGALVGALLGAFAGAAFAVALEGGSGGEALSTGLAAFRGRLLGFIVKAGIAVAMLAVLLAALI